MPIILQKYKWHQTETEIIVRVIFPERITSNVDIFTHKAFIKVNCSPFFFEKFLQHPINDKESRCKILEQEIIFYLKKLEQIKWNSLEIDVCKAETVMVKEDLIKETHEISEQRKKERLQRKDDLKKEEIHKQMDRETKIRNTIEKHNSGICDGVVNSIEEWKDEKNEEILKEINEKVKPQENVKPEEKLKNESDTYKKLFFRPAPENEKINLKPITKTPQKKKENTGPPPIRQCSSIEVNFTERKFTTPSRESTEQEEMEWLTKQHEAQKATGFVEGDLRPEERNPQWLKEKGDTFLKQYNYLGAISAYSTAIKLTNKNYELYFNRALAHFPLENYKKCVEDCSTAIDLLKPHCEGNRMARVNCIARRGLALSRCGFIREGYEELVAAIKLDPKNTNLIQQAEMLRCKLERGEK